MANTKGTQKGAFHKAGFPADRESSSQGVLWTPAGKRSSLLQQERTENFAFSVLFHTLLLVLTKKNVCDKISVIIRNLEIGGYYDT